MAEPTARAYTEEEQKKREAEAALDEMLQPMMAEQNRYMVGDGTVGNPVRGAVSEQLAATKPTEPAQTPAQPDAYETEYAAATTPQEKAQVAAKHGDWQKAYGNAQNAIGEVRTKAETLEQQLEAERTRPAPQVVQQPAQPQQNFNDFQVVQPRDEYDTEAQRLNEGFRNFAVVLGQGLQQGYGKQLQDIASAVEGLRKMPSDYSVDAQTEARIVNELGISDLPEWRQKQLVQRFAGQQTRSTTPSRQTPQEAAVQRAVNYVEPSNSTASVVSSETAQIRMQREYEDARAKETDPLKKNKAGRDVLLKYGVQQVEDHRRLPI